MQNVGFKVGDLVYFPRENAKIWILEKNPSDNCDNSDYSLAIIKDGCAYTFMSDGRIFIRSELPHIFHATPENHAKLEALYGIEFEKPPACPTSIKIVKAMLAMGDEYVECWVDNNDVNPTDRNDWALIAKCETDSDFHDDPYPFIDTNGIAWKYATPFDPKTGEAITELPNE